MKIYLMFSLSKNGDHIMLTKSGRKKNSDPHPSVHYELNRSNIDNEPHLTRGFKKVLKQCIESKTRAEVLSGLSSLKRLLSPYPNRINHHEQMSDLNTYIINKNPKDEIELGFWHP